MSTKYLEAPCIFQGKKSPFLNNYYLFSKLNSKVEKKYIYDEKTKNKQLKNCGKIIKEKILLLDIIVCLQLCSQFSGQRSAALYQVCV